MQVIALFLSLCVPCLFSSVPFRQSTATAPPSDTSFAEKISLPGVHNAGKVSEQLFRGSQPRLSYLSELKKLGITTIIDLRSESPHKRNQERSRAASLGIHFVSIPVGGFSNPISTQLAQFFALLRASPPQKIFVHCEFGEDRTGVFIAAYRIAFDGWSAEQATSEMLAFGFRHFWHPSMACFVRSLPDRLQSDPVLKSALTAAVD
jgi:protein tyrosine/serine phosphatase